ncbi:MAG: hypothetical protein ACN6O3_20795 [Comamonas sp.]
MPSTTPLLRLLGGCLLAAAALSGCASLDQMAADNYRRQCDGLGIARGTPTYDQCMLQQQAIEEQGVQRSMDRAAMRKHAY